MLTRQPFIVLILGCVSALADPPPPAYEAVNDSNHTIAGMPGWTVARTKAATHCGGVAVTVKHTKSAPKGDEAFAELLVDVPPSADLGSFQKNFDARMAWSTKHDEKIAAVLKSYVDLATKSTGMTKLAAVGRIVELKYHLALLAQYAELPKYATTTEARDEFCKGLVGQAKRVFESARTDLVACAGLVKAGPRGWWDNVCR